MTYLTSWEEFAKAAERLYLNDPIKVYRGGSTYNSAFGKLVDRQDIRDAICRFVTKYRHCDGKLCVKVTDDKACFQYRTEHAQDVKKLEKLTGHLMRHMASKEK